MTRKQAKEWKAYADKLPGKWGLLGRQYSTLRRFVAVRRHAVGVGVFVAITRLRDGYGVEVGYLPDGKFETLGRKWFKRPSDAVLFLAEKAGVDFLSAYFGVKVPEPELSPEDLAAVESGWDGKHYDSTLPGVPERKSILRRRPLKARKSKRGP